MKIDRILGIIIYLLNHDKVSAKTLAEKYNVSVRTVQRDMVNIASSGIPIYSDNGKNGGYSILPTYKLKNTNIKSDEQQIIIKALESLSTSYTNHTLESIIQKYNTIIGKEGGQKIFWDFGVTKENQRVQDVNKILEHAITDKRYIYFHYRNASGKEADLMVEPLAIHYKWYAWYLFAYNDEKEQYYTFKVARMENIEILNRKSFIDHGDIEVRMKESEQNYYKTCINIEVHFKEQESNLIQEYFPDCPIEKMINGMCRIFISVPAKERLWRALLLSFGNRVKVVAPEEYKKELIDTAEKFLSNYDS
ncbi:putative uncharacterized protein [Clostridium sp. CAG:253]|nr:putative uncharacterized protein [Clostridium sp. CAG:253]